MNEFELLEKDLMNNITDWYEFDPNIHYIILKDLNRENQEQLKQVAKNLKENERLLLTFDNRLSMKHFCQIEKNNENLFIRKEIENILRECGLNYQKFYYPLPDAHMTNVIFTDSHLPDMETLSRNLVFYSNENMKIYEQNNEWEELLKQDKELFKVFANSFLIECSKFEFVANETQFVSYSNMRKPEYRIQTKIVGDKVYKKAAQENANQHIEEIKHYIDLLHQIGLDTLDSYESNRIISQYQKDKPTLDKYILMLLEQNRKEEANRIIDHLMQILKEKLVILSDNSSNVFDKYHIEYHQEDIQKMTFVKYGLWDLIFSNIFYIENKYYFYDQEWLEEKLPLEYIIYRSFHYNAKLKDLMKDRYDINSKEVDLFMQLDDKLQEKIRNPISWKMHAETMSISYQLQKSQKDIEQITQDCQNLLLEKDSRIKFLEDNMEQTCHLLKEKEEELNGIKNSISWKITKPLRGARKFLK